MLTEVIVLQQIEVAHLLSHGDLLHSALVQVELLGNINVTVQNRPHTGLSTVELHRVTKTRACFDFWTERRLTRGLEVADRNHGTPQAV